MKSRSLIRVGFVALVLVAVWFTFVSLRFWRQDEPGYGLRLERPALTRTVYADTGDIGSRLDDEAGIAAYYDAGQTINLSRVVNSFRTREIATDDYIIGSVAIPGYLEHSDAHVYVHRSGWILAYYPHTTPVSKIVDVVGATITTTKLEKAIVVLADAAGLSLSNVKYYHFGYPNATHMMLIAEDDANGNDFTVQLPATFNYFERSWAVRRVHCGCLTGVAFGTFKLDGVDNPNVVFDEPYIGMYGLINGSQLATDTTHTIAIQYYGVLALVYRMP